MDEQTVRAKKSGKGRAVMYSVAIVFAIGVFLYLQYYASQPQPRVIVLYSAATQTGTGTVNNILPYPIIVTDIYCTANGMKYEFANNNDNAIQPDQTRNISFSVTSNSASLPGGCSGWNVLYTKAT